MKVTLNWLREYVEIDIDPTELAHRMTLAGLEVTSLEHIGQNWSDKVYVGRVVSREPHPNADRLQLVTVDYGRDQIVVVTGAFNLVDEDRVPLALAGAKLYDGHSAERRLADLKPGKVRGIMSEGMVCSEKELGFGEDHEGIMILDGDAPVGSPLYDYLGDVVFDIELTPNLAHALSVVGVAREVAALLGKVWRTPETEWQTTGRPIEDDLSVEVVDPDLCPRYSAALIRDVEIGPSPGWMQRRLKLCGVRPINNVVDITNYVMLEWGQPMHAFDADAVAGRKIIVRRAFPGEMMTTIDHVTREMTPDTLLIADPQGGIGIAGIMGGFNTEIGPSTRAIALESANFNRVNIRRASRALKLRTEASLRFEKGLDPALTTIALRRAGEFMRTLAGGTIAQGILDAYAFAPPARTVHITPREVRRILGVEVPRAQITEVLETHGFECKDAAGEAEEIAVAVPSFRGDVTLAADLIEEVARTIGYDRIPATMISDVMPEPALNRSLALENEIRDLLAAAGLQEVITYSLTSIDLINRLAGSEAGDGFDPESLLKVANPLNPEHEYLRPQLLPSVLEIVQSNRRHEDRVAIFEVGRVYLSNGTDQLPREPRHLALALAGSRSDLSRFGAGGEMDFFDVKGVVETLLTRLGVGPASFEPVAMPGFHPGRSAAVKIGGQVIGHIGEVHPSVADSFDVGARLAVAEIDLERTLAEVPTAKGFLSVSRFPAVSQDIAVVVPEEIPAGRVQEMIRQTGGKLVREVTLFDIYAGPPIPPGKKSLAYRLVFQSMERTLTDDEVAKVRQKIEHRIGREMGGQLRV